MAGKQLSDSFNLQVGDDVKDLRQRSGKVLQAGADNIELNRPNVIGSNPKRKTCKLKTIGTIREGHKPNSLLSPVYFLPNYMICVFK